MSNNIKYVGVAVLAGLLVVAGYLVKKPTTITYNTDGTKTVIGSVSSPDIQSPYFSFGGVRNWGYSRDLNQASTTLCSFVTPASTSTLDFGSVQVTTGTSSVISVEIAKDTAAGGGNAGTTTRLAYLVTTANQKFTLLASTSPLTALTGITDVNTPWIFGPNNYLNFKIGGALGGLNALVGSCKAIFREN